MSSSIEALVRGANEIRVAGRNEGGPAAMFCSLTLELKGGDVTTLVSDSSWSAQDDGSATKGGAFSFGKSKARMLDAMEAALQAGTWQSDLPRLEALKDVSQMSVVDYQEVWAWVHFLMHSSPLQRSMLKEYLKERLRPGAVNKPLPIQNQQEALQVHLKQLVADRSSWPH